MSGEHSHPELDMALGNLDQVVANLMTRVEQVAGELAVANARISRLTAQVASLEAAASAPQDVFDYDYLGKPAGTLTIGRTYTRLDLSEWTPGAVGWDHLLYYLNIKPTFYAGKSGGAIRPRLVRVDGDNTAYDDLELHADCLDDDGRALKTRLYWEAGDGTTTFLELKCIGGLRTAEIGTRYVKRATIKDRG